MSPILPRSRDANAAPAPPPQDNATQAAKAPPPKPQATGYAFVGAGDVSPVPRQPSPPHPESSAVKPTVPASTLAALCASDSWEKLPQKVQVAILAYATRHRDAVDAIADRLPLFGEICTAQESRDPQAFGKWLQGQRESLEAILCRVLPADP